jgi:hypothetical protein
MSIELAREALRQCQPFVLVRHKELLGEMSAISVERSHPHLGVWRMTLEVSIEVLRDAVALRRLLESSYAAGLRRQAN